LLAPSEFDREKTRGYLDTGTFGLPPRSSLQALERALAGWRDGAPWRMWEEDGEASRALFARLVGVETENVALLPALSSAAGLVAASLRAGRGDNVVLYKEDFTSTLLPWQALEHRGVELRAVALAELASAIDERTALVAVSSVQSADGALADVESLREAGVPLFVDATQAVGAVPVDASGLDYLAAHSYKWLLCPRGLTFLYVSPERLGEVEPWTAGWKSRREPYEHYYGFPELTEGARRLDVSLAWLVAAGARPSLELIADVGVARIAAHDLGLARSFAAGLGLPEPEAPIVRVTVENAEGAVERLRAAGVACSARAGSVRLCFHLYNDAGDVELALEALAPVAAVASG
jgi:selenocysteine lyase/cysteine desulfurase